ncbi:MAG: PAS domain-containing protein [Candidatus Sabulitectum sp.]|nr:PAS domain-containing protein [Candidatus Sabulitectum sp.]
MQDQLGGYKQRFRQILRALPCGYIYGEVLVNGNGEPEDYSVLDVNHAFSDMTATTRNKVLGRRISGLFSLSSVKEDIAVFVNVALTGDPVEKEFFSPHFGIHFRVFCYAPMDGFFVALLTDLSGEKKLENRLDFIRKFGNSTSDEFFILDSTGKFILGNAAVGRKLGTDQGSIPGHSYSELSIMVEGDWWDTLWKSLLQRGSLQFETDHRGKDGVVYPVELSVDLMEFGGRRYAAFVAKNISNKQILSKALRQDRRFAEQAASMAGYFVWMVDSNGVFRPLLGGNSSLVAGPVNDVFFSLFHSDDRAECSRAIMTEVDGSRELRMKAGKGTEYYKFKWSYIEDSGVVGICYPLSGAGLSGMGSHSMVMDAIDMMNESMLERMNQLEGALTLNKVNAAIRMIRSIYADFSNMTGENHSPERVRLDVFLSENEGLLRQLLQPAIPLEIDASLRAVGFCDPAFIESVLARLLLIIQDTGLTSAISLRSFSDSSGAGICVTVSGHAGIQTALERSFIPVKSRKPGLASVYAMVRSGGGRVYYETLDDQIEFRVSFPKRGMEDDSAFILIALPDQVDAARASAALKDAGFSVAIESSFPEIQRRIREEKVGVLIISADMVDFSPDEIMTGVSGVFFIQIGGEQSNPEVKLLPGHFRTSDLVTCVKQTVSTKAEMLQAADLPSGNLWGEPHLMPPLS